MGKPYRAPDPPPLPKVRVAESPPFTVTGVDFTGALYVKTGGQERKVYICLFTCAATRAVHLEVVSDLTVDTFLLAFRRFSSRKSLPRKMITGALYVKTGGQERKVYICLFTCAATRAVHLEVVSDLTVDTFLLAFRRFSSRKSLPRKMISDSASAGCL